MTTPIVVVDASVGVAAVIGAVHAEWALQVIADAPAAAAPPLFFAEAASALRRIATSDAALADRAYTDLVRLPLEVVEFGPCAERIWELRANVTASDAWYVAAAELLHAPLATLDRRLRGAPGTTCSFLTPDGGHP